MGFCGLVPSEYSSGQVTSRGHITKAGNLHLRTQLVEAVWAYQHRPSVGAQIARRQQGLDPQVVAAPGLPSCGCAGASDAYAPASPPPTSSPPRSPGSWPGSCGPR